MNELLLKRVKSLLWRAAMMGVAVALAFLAENLASLELGETVTVVLGLVLGEISKALNTPRV